MFYFDHMSITAADLERSIRFYTALGFSILRRWSYAPRGMDACMMKNQEDKCIELFHFAQPIPAPDTVGSHYARDGEAIEEDLPQIGLKHLAFRVKNLDDALAHLRASGLCTDVDVMDGGLGNRYFFLRDPDGVFVEFMENPCISD